VGDSFYLDYQGAGAASLRLENRARDLSGASADLSGASVCNMGPVSTMVDEVVAAATGRMFAFSDELDILSKLVDSTVTVYNQLDVTYSKA
jgi:hypothetical protein